MRVQVPPFAPSEIVEQSNDSTLQVTHEAPAGGHTVGHKSTSATPLQIAFAPDDEVTELPAARLSTGDHRSALVRALADGAAQAFAAGDTRAAMLALDTVRALVGDTADGTAAPVVDLGAERRKRGER